MDFSVVCFDLIIGSANEICASYALDQSTLGFVRKFDAIKTNNKNRKMKNLKLCKKVVTLQNRDEVVIEISLTCLIYLQQSEVSFFRLFLNLRDDLKESGRHFSPITNVQLNLKYFTTEKK